MFPRLIPLMLTLAKSFSHPQTTLPAIPLSFPCLPSLFLKCRGTGDVALPFMRRAFCLPPAHVGARYIVPSSRGDRTNLHHRATRLARSPTAAASAPICNAGLSWKGFQPALRSPRAPNSATMAAALPTCHHLAPVFDPVDFPSSLLHLQRVGPHPMLTPNFRLSNLTSWKLILIANSKKSWHALRPNKGGKASPSSSKPSSAC